LRRQRDGDLHAGLGQHVRAGHNHVACTATDGAGNSGTCSFTVTLTKATLPLCRDFNDNNLHGWQPDPDAPNVGVTVVPGGQDGASDYYVQVSDLAGDSAVMAAVSSTATGVV